MITIMKIETLDETAYNHIYCPQCNNKIGWKEKGEKVHILRLSQNPNGKLRQSGLTCVRCKTHYIIAFENE